MRKNMFILTLLVGLALAVIGFLMSAPVGPTLSPVVSNPRLPFAPTLFILGIVVVFASAVVYELVPDKKEKQ